MVDYEGSVKSGEIKQFEEKVARAKKLLQLYNDITFGNKVQATESKIRLMQMI